MDEKRKFSRISFATGAQLTQADKVWTTNILDLSLNGALVEEPANFSAEKSPIVLSFSLQGSDIQVQMETSLIHQKSGHLGLRCQHIDVESISHLRRMIELNVGDSLLLNRELELFIADHESS
ncbi:PilZ domain-containing protein [Shewanella eurypsychrophilus]|uniref:Cyclic diguanosine monophosphate-binding protein n=1 Tax=Shewanella eurypsychrophilus TaxID=2593656 RepID=A0ABX6VC82_9GAMM|nr:MULTISPECIES: PilZ domain-containing protein [Shewanella]QFU23934.1 PilZ domain-containing protein [Shewanella sp. YLB-09]QPG59150.1 PilZ domain-containing protein [Shewanella eurypsychrophilus]